MERLVGVVRDLSQARSVEAIAAIVREAGRSLTGADGATFVLRDDDQCRYVDENAITPLWKGRSFPMSACVSGWAMQHATSVVIEDIYSDPRVPVDAYRPTFVKSLAMVPIRRNSPIGAIGNYWATRHLPTKEEVAILQALADTTSVALQNVELFDRLREQVLVLHRQHGRIQEQKDTIEVFARAMAHDLKEPVRTMKAFSRIAASEEGGAENRARYLGFIQDAADRMGVLVDSVMQYMQLDHEAELAADVCDMQVVMDSVRQNLAHLIEERGAVVENGPLPVVRACEGHMMQLLQNLVSNAIHHNDRAVRVRVDAKASTGGWEFAVRDNGCGISPEYSQTIFQPFKRLDRKQNHAGVGLAICEKITARYGGGIRCESTPGQGAAFVFDLPGVPSIGCESQQLLFEVQPNAVAEAEPLASLLLVDDGPDDLVLTQMMIEHQAKLKCRVFTAKSGEDALAVLRTEKIDLVLLDINMPKLDGFETLERMRQNALTRNTAVIMCTGSDYNRDRDKARSLDADGYLLKPPRFDQLKPMIESIPSLRLCSEGSGYSLIRTLSSDAA